MTIKRSKIRESARGQDCQVRIGHVCNFNPETTVFAHRNGAGLALKASNLHGSYCCSSCHDVIDGRVPSGYTPVQIELMFFEGIMRTQLLLIEQGLVILK